MYVFVEPVTEEQVTKVQNSKKALVEAYERKVLGLDAKEPSVGHKASTSKKSSMQSTNVDSERHKAKPKMNKHSPLSQVEEQEVENAGRQDASASDASPLPADNDKSANDASKVDDVVRESVEEASADTSASDKTVQDAVVEKLSDSIESGDTQFLEKVAEKVAKVKVEHGPLLGFVVRTRSFVDGQHVPRPEELTKDQTWTLQYTIAEIDNPERARSLYDAVIVRRKGLLGRTEEDDVRESDYFINKLKAITAQSKRWREELDAADAGKPSIEWNANDNSDESELLKQRDEVIRGLIGIRKLAKYSKHEFMDAIKTVQKGFNGLSNGFRDLFASAGIKDHSTYPLELGPAPDPPRTGPAKIEAAPVAKIVQPKVGGHVLDNIADQNFSTRNTTSRPEQSRSDPVLEGMKAERIEKVKTLRATVMRMHEICSEHYFNTRNSGSEASVPEAEVKEILRMLVELPRQNISRTAECPPGLSAEIFRREWEFQLGKVQAEISQLARALAKEELTTKVVEGKLRVLFNQQFNKPFLGGKVPAPPTSQMESTFNVQDYSAVLTPSTFEAPKQQASSALDESIESGAQHESREAISGPNIPEPSSTEQDNLSNTKEERNQNVLGTSVDSTNFPQPDVVELEGAVQSDIAVGTQTSLSNSDRNDAVSDEAESTPEVDSSVDLSHSSSAQRAEDAEDNVEGQVKSTSSVDEVTISVPKEQERK